ncbi:MAG: hypothetical protein HQK65_16450 [Desulfamplus sp.]|nr:hypothetical protein [Desulfamplus sp.]
MSVYAKTAIKADDNAELKTDVSDDAALKADAIPATPSPAVAFTFQGDQPEAWDYVLKVIFHDSVVQMMPPALYSINALTDLLEELKVKYSIDRNTGVIAIEDAFYFKPDYLMNRLSASDMQYWTENRDSKGVAWKEVDFNQDGIADLEMFTSEGRQVLYQLDP